MAQRSTVGLWLLAFFALALRVAVVAVLGSGGEGPRTYEHGEIAANLLAGRGFSVTFLGAEGPTSQQAPFYPVLLGGAYWLFGQTTAALIALELLQCLAGTALVLCVVWLAWSLFPQQPSVGWFAGCCAAIYPPHLYMVTHIQVVTWAALSLTLLLAIVASRRWAGTWIGAILAGTVAGWLLLVEPILALALPVVGIWFLLRARQAQTSEAPSSKTPWHALAQSGVLVLVAAVVVAPWLVRNYRVHGQFVFIKSTFGYAFWQGNNAASWGTDKLPQSAAETARTAHDGTLAGMNQALWNARHKTRYIDDVLLTPADYAQLKTLSEPERSKLLFDRAKADVTHDPSGYLVRCLRRLRYFLLFDETNPKAANNLYRASTILWLVLSLIGAIGCGRRWKTLWPLGAIFLIVTLFHALTITSARFRMPLEPLAFVWTATALAPLIAGLLPARRMIAVVEESKLPLGAHPLAGPHFRHSRVSSKSRAA
jgi:hypothetical protein